MSFLTSTFLAIGSFVVTYSQAAMFAFAMAIQSFQAGQMRKRQRDAEEARKGFEMVNEGSVVPLPIVYGRAKVGGVRAFMETSSTFKYVSTPSDKTFNLGYAPKPARTVRVLQRNPEGGGDAYIYVDRELPATDGGLMSRNYSGHKNEYLFVQQALCMGPINGVYDLEIAERSIKDPSLVSGDEDKPKAAFRADLYYSGGVACNLITANFGHRATAKFPGVAYMSYFVRLDRDEPQFQNLPPVIAAIEGRKVRTISASNVLSTERTYTNNPAYCLLDYLLDPVVGAKLSLSEIDIPSFKAAAAVCDTVVLTGATVGGPVWQPADGARSVSARSVPLYELNIMLDTSKPIRSNIEAILTCMGDARLVWSRGQYKLLMQYPDSNASTVLSGELTDDDLVQGQTININWPTTSDRLNYATIRYNDEANWFKENSASWPPKEAGVYARGIGGRSYPVPPTNWGNDTGDHITLLKSYGVWNSADSESDMSWKVFVRYGGVYTLTYAVDDTVTGSINGSAFTGSFGTAYSKSITVADNSVVSINVHVVDTGGDKGFAATLTSSNSVQVWTTRSPAYTAMQVVNQTSEVYDTYLAEDNGVPLETDAFSDGITDYYHALAKAEELVRTSRSAFLIEFKYFLRDKFFEPGDYVRLDSKLLGISDLIVRVGEVSVDDNLTVTVKGSRFDYTQLAWNVDDNVAGGPTPVWTEKLPAPSFVRYEAGSEILSSSSGRVVWGEVNDVRVTGYRIYYNPNGQLTASGQLAFVELGRSPNSPFDLPPLAQSGAIFGVRSMSAGGMLSEMTLSSATLLEKGPPPPKATDLTATGGKTIELSWTIPAVRDDDTEYSDHMTTIVWRSSFNDFSGAKSVGQSQGSSFSDSSVEYGELYYWVQLVSRTSVEGPPSDPAGPVLFSVGGGIDPGAAVPPPPFNLQVTPGLTFFHLSWQVPNHAVGGGHKSTRIYGAEWANDTTEPAVGSMQLLAEVTDTVLFFPAAIAKKWSFIAREVSQAGGLSSAYAGPVDAKTGKIGNSDLGEYIVDADNLADGAITADKFLPGIEFVQWYGEGTPLPTEKGAEYISMNGILYYWRDGAYVRVVRAIDFDGQLLESQIADGVINTAKFAAGLAPVELVSALPATGNFEGRVVSLTTEGGALYHYSGGAWQANVAPGSITETAIAPDSITTPMLKAGAVKAGKIDANAVTAGTIAAGAVNTGELAANAVTAVKIATDAVTADKILARTITGGKIAAGAISSYEIEAYSITADNLATDSVIAGKIKAGAIVAGKLAANAIVAGDGVIANLAVQTSQIANAAITSAKIMDLEVDTIKIRGNAVSLPLPFNGAGQYNLNGNANQVYLTKWYDQYTIPDGTPLMVVAAITYKGLTSGMVDFSIGFGGYMFNGYYVNVESGVSGVATVVGLSYSSGTNNYITIRSEAYPSSPAVFNVTGVVGYLIGVKR